MKKYVLCLLCLILIGCHHSASTENSSINETDKENSSSEITNNQEESSDTSKESKSDSPANNIESQLNHDEIMALNFSSVIGEYVNSEGKSIFLGENLKERMLGDDISYHDGYYFLNVKSDDEMYGIGLAIYDAGVEVPNFESLTDITKVRMCYTQAGPMALEEIYTKK